MKLSQAYELTANALVEAARHSSIHPEMVSELQQAFRNECKLVELLNGVTWLDLFQCKYWELPVEIRANLFENLA